MSHYKRYPKYKDSGIESIGEVPADWNTKSLCRVVSCNDDALPDDTPDDTALRYVDISSVDHAEGIKHVADVRFGDAPSRARRKAKSGDVVISTVRTYLKAVAPVTPEYADCVYSTGFAVLRPRPGDVSPGFLKWMMLDDLLVQTVEAHSEGLSYPAINATELVKLKAPVPSPAEQAVIATALDRETTRIGALIAKKTRFIKLLKEKRRALITHAVTKGLDPSVKMKDSGVEWIGEAPAHWDVCRLGALYREAARPGNPALPVLSISIHDGITDDEVAPEDRDRKVYLSEDRTKYKTVKPNDLAYNMMRAWQGAFGAVTVPGLVSPAYVVAQPLLPLRSAYVEHLLRTSMAIEEMRRFSRGIADFRMRLYWEYFRDLRVCVPPLAEQEAVLAAVARESDRVDRLTAKTERSIALLKERRSALITAAVTGQIDLREVFA